MTEKTKTILIVEEKPSIKTFIEMLSEKQKEEVFVYDIVKVSDTPDIPNLIEKANRKERRRLSFLRRKSNKRINKL